MSIYLSVCCLRFRQPLDRYGSPYRFSKVKSVPEKKMHPHKNKFITFPFEIETELPSLSSFFPNVPLEASRCIVASLR